MTTKNYLSKPLDFESVGGGGGVYVHLRTVIVELGMYVYDIIVSYIES